MSSSKRRFAFSCVIVMAFGSAVLLAQAGSANVPNWTVPAYRASGAEGGLTTMTDNSPGVAFVAMQPCRVFDTRDPVGPYGGPRLIANTTRNFDIDSGPCTGIGIAGLVQAYSMNFGAILADGDGFITIWPAGAAQPVVSSMNTLAGEVIANAAIVAAGSGGAISIFPNTGVHLYGDINGYFTQGASGAFPYFFWQTDNSGTFGAAIIVNTYAGTSDSFGVVGRANSTGNGTAALFGTSFSTTNYTFGVKGVTNSTGDDAAGVKGVEGASGDPLGDTLDCTVCFEAGVRGVSTDNHGVLGITRFWSGVTGANLASTGTVVDTYGRLGYATYGVFSAGDYGGTAGKYFVEPHPTDPSLVIKYVTLEGPEAGTYFRGKARFDRGTAVIEVPEDFRMVTDSEGLSIQVTPIGEMATVAVASIGLDRIVVRGSRNVEFFYTVNGVRRTMKGHRPIQASVGEYMPAKPGAKLVDQGWLREEQKRVLIQNGTYQVDGTVNMETARRLGWDRMWQAREHPQPQPEPPTNP
jgi:hypothetical protein